MPPIPGRKLGRQLRETLGREDALERVARIRERQPPPDEDLPAEVREGLELLAGLPELLTEVDATYSRAEELNQAVHAMVDSLGQGFLVFDRAGICQPTYSRACEVLLECVPAGRDVVEILRIPPEKRAGVREWIELLFGDLIDFKDLAALGPQSYEHTGSLYVTLEFKPVRDGDGAVAGIVMIATDHTDELEALQRAETLRRDSERIVKLAHDRDSFLAFVRLLRSGIADLRAWRNRLPPPRELEDAARVLHTLKGLSGAFFIDDLRTTLHQLESSLLGDPALFFREADANAARLQAQIDAFIRANSAVLGRDFEHAGRSRRVPVDRLHAFERLLGDGPTAEALRESFRTWVLSERLGDIVTRFEAYAQTTARCLRKRLNPIEIEGGDLRLVPESFASVLENLVHLFTNSVDHGIGTPEERRAEGKPPEGTIRVRIDEGPFRGGVGLRLRVSDDGEGICADRVRRKLQELGDAPQALAALPDEEVIQRIFDDGLSTAANVTEHSGQGRGLSALREAVHGVGGAIEVSSVRGQGTTFTLWLPRAGSPAVKNAYRRVG